MRWVKVVYAQLVEILFDRLYICMHLLLQKKIKDVIVVNLIVFMAFLQEDVFSIYIIRPFGLRLGRGISGSLFLSFSRSQVANFLK